MQNGSIKQWIYTPTLGKETPVVNITGIDGTYLYPVNGGGGWNNMWPNSYANANQGDGAGPTHSLTFGYEDNWTVTNGTPVTCAQIGFGKV